MDMTQPLLARALAAAGLAALMATLAACNNGGSSSSTTAPTGPGTADPPYTGTIQLGSADFFPFTTVVAGGEVDIVFTSETPTTNPPIVVEIGVASADGLTCTPQTSTAQILQAVVNPIYPPFTTAAAGTFCVYLQDAFSQGPIGYTFTVTHH
jgi:hypothetical protein